MLAGLWPSSEVWGLQPHWVGLGNGSVVPALKPLWIFCWAAMDEWIPFHFITRLPCNRSLLYLKYPLLLLFSCSAISDSLRPHGLQHARLPCPSQSPGLFAQIHVHWVSDAIQPSQLLFLLSPVDLNLSQHHSLFQWVVSLHQVAKVLELQLQHQSFQWIFRVDFL